MKPLLVLALCVAASAQNSNSRLASIVGPLADANSPGIAVLVRDHGNTVFQHTAGLTDLRTRTAITGSTDFRLASCTKQFTAMAIMLLVHDGKLRYDERLTEIFPGFPAYGRAITLRNVLNHTSGLPDYEDLMELPSNRRNQWTAERQITDAEVLKLLEAADHGKFAPGTQWAYSNSGYVLLGQVVAKVSGMSFPEFLRRRIFLPLKMTNTVAYVRGSNTVPNRAYGHSRPSGDVAQRNPAFAETDQSSTSATLGDGGVYSNLEDLARWDDALAHHTLLGEAEMRHALTPFRLPGPGKSAGQLPKWSGDSGDSDPQAGKPVAYGFGWFLDPFVDAAGKAHPRMWHYGDTIGFKSAIVRFTGSDRLGGLTIIVLTNRSDLDPAKVADKFAEAKVRP